MRGRSLALAWGLLAAAACTRPLVEPVDGSPPGAHPTPVQDGGGSTPIRNPFLDAGMVPAGIGCWWDDLPAQVQPILPRAPVDMTCRIDAATVPWGYPQDPQPNLNADGRANIVGRWIACSAPTSFHTIRHTGVEFGANGRWQLLTVDGAGALAPVNSPDAAGYYYLLGTGQLNVMGEGPTGGQIRNVTFAAGMDALRFEAPGTPGGIYARTEPSPANGTDNLPSVTDGRCSLFGDWDLPANPNPPGAPAATFSFNGVGDFVGGPLGTDLCAAHTMYGTYRLSPGWFQLTSNVGMGACAWWFTAAYPAVFADDCSSVTLTQMIDGCTGGRGYFNQVTTLTRRR